MPQTSVTYSGSSTTGQENESNKHEQLATSSEGISKLVGCKNNSFSIPLLEDDWLRHTQRKRRKTTKRSREFRTSWTRGHKNHYPLDYAATVATVSFGERETGQRESELRSTNNNFFSDPDDQASWSSARVPGNAPRFPHRWQPRGVAHCNDSCPTAFSSEISGYITSFFGAEVGGIRTVELPLLLYWSSQDRFNVSNHLCFRNDWL